MCYSTEQPCLICINHEENFHPAVQAFACLQVTEKYIFSGVRFEKSSGAK